MISAAKIFFQGPSVKDDGSRDSEVSVAAQTPSSRDYQAAVSERDFDAANDISRAHMVAKFPDLAAHMGDKETPVGNVRIGPALGSCLSPYMEEGELVFETAEPPRPHCLAIYRLTDEPEDFGRVKIFLGTTPVPPSLDVGAVGWKRRPRAISWFYQTNPLVIYGISDADIGRVRYCQRLQGPIEEPFPLNEEHGQAIAAAMGLAL